MDEVRGRRQGDQLVIALSGRIDSGNAPDAEAAILDLTKDEYGRAVTIDAQALEYISSAGLRVLLRLRKKYPEMRIINVSSDVYEILDMTGFNQMMTVEKAYRQVSIEGCEIIGRGANGTVYRIDGDNVVKVYTDADALEDIQRERELARLALVLGIPTAISYDVVRVGDSYGSVFELLDARSFSKILGTQPEKMDWCVQEYVELLKTIHGTLVPEGKLPDMKDTALDWANFMQEHLPPESGQKLVRLIEEVPRDNHMIHGDYHTKNLQLTGDEVLLIDMDTLAVGHPVFELGSMYNAFVGFGEYDPTLIERFMGFSADIAAEFWHRSLAAYLGYTNPEAVKAVEDKARIVGYTRMIRRSIRRGGLEDPEQAAAIDLWRKHLIDLLATTDTLLFTAEETGGGSNVQVLELEALRENLPQVMEFVDSQLEQVGCGIRDQMQIDVAVEEIYINIASYAYSPGTGSVVVRVEIAPDPLTAIITFIDHGVPYDPLAKEDPDVTLSAEERQIGGLGIFMVKQSMDDVVYEYKDGQNMLTLKKKLSQ